jgi:hypothetical protein
MNRRDFCKTSSLFTTGAYLLPGIAADAAPGFAPRHIPLDLPQGSAPKPVEFPHFPDRLSAFVWRNWPLVPVRRMALVLQAEIAQINGLAKLMGLPKQGSISNDQLKRSALTIIRRNWHLLPYEQLLTVLDWTPEQMAFTLREDDFLYVKLGSLKPRCEPLSFQPPDEVTTRKLRAISGLLREQLAEDISFGPEELFGFLSEFQGSAAKTPPQGAPAGSVFDPRFCYSYFALYGDPLLDPSLDPYPDGYLEQLRNSGVSGVWLQGVLSRLAPFPWNPEASRDWQKRLENLRRMVRRAKQFGIGVYLYLNEPRAMPVSFFKSHAELKGVVEGDFAALCSSHPEVQSHLANSIATIVRAVPDLAGFFTITASENLSNCWSHGGGAGCPRCSKREPAQVIAEVNSLIVRGIKKADGRSRLIAWDWGWNDSWAPEAIDALPPEATLMSVSEWSLPIERGGTKTTVGEYSISAIGPGPRAKKHWQRAKARGLRTVAKVQAGNTWELSAVPYIPALENVARHITNLRAEHVDGIMLGWTLGGYPSPNLEMVAEIGKAAGPDSAPTVGEALASVATRRFGPLLAPAVVEAWRQFSAAFSQFPFHGGLVYVAPMQFGPSNLLWGKPTGYAATMIGFPYDDLNGWRAVYPTETFIALFEAMAKGFEDALQQLDSLVRLQRKYLKSAQARAIDREISVARAAAIHFRTTANQARFVRARNGLLKSDAKENAGPLLSEIDSVLKNEIGLAKQLFAIQTRDSRIGFEASNQYYYVPADLLEKIINCHDLLTNWLPAQKARLGG